jgi:hypothetical protein
MAAGVRWCVCVLHPALVGRIMLTFDRGGIVVVCVLVSGAGGEDHELHGAAAAAQRIPLPGKPKHNTHPPPSRKASLGAKPTPLTDRLPDPSSETLSSGKNTPPFEKLVTLPASF